MGFFSMLSINIDKLSVKPTPVESLGKIDIRIASQLEKLNLVSGFKYIVSYASTIIVAKLICHFLFFPILVV